MEDYCDGLQFKNHLLYSHEPQSLQIMLYYDEVELCSPLGAAKKIHKVGKSYTRKFPMGMCLHSRTCISKICFDVVGCLSYTCLTV